MPPSTISALFGDGGLSYAFDEDMTNYKEDVEMEDNVSFVYLIIFIHS
jgi:hypothetical protein